MNCYIFEKLLNVWNEIHVEFGQIINMCTIYRIIFTVVKQTFVKCSDEIDEKTINYEWIR